MSKRRTRAQKQLQDERKKQDPQPSEQRPRHKVRIEVSDEQLLKDRVGIFGFLLNTIFFTLANPLLGFLFVYTVSIERLAIFLLWSVALAEHSMRVSRDIGFWVGEGIGYGSRWYDKDFLIRLKLNSLQKIYDPIKAIKGTYWFIAFMHITICFVFIFVFFTRFSSAYVASASIEWLLLTTLSVLLGLGIHAATVYLRGGFRMENRKAKPQFDGLMPGNETLRQDIIYVVSDDGELVEAAGDLGHEKRKP
jgi:hypothetical protein